MKYTAAGDRLSPALNWTNTPPSTVSFVLHMHDLDAAINHTTEDSLHWLMWNIPGSATTLSEGIPQGVQLKDGSYQVSSKTPLDQRGQGYRAPGAGANGPMHHYTFEILALDTKLDVTPAADAFETRRNVMKALQGHVLGKAVYMGLFHLPPGSNPKPLPGPAGNHSPNAFLRAEASRGLKPASARLAIEIISVPVHWQCRSSPMAAAAIDRV